MKLLPAFALLLGVHLLSSPTLATDAPSTTAAGDTPLHLAALRDDADAVESLLAAGADPNALNRHGATPLHYGISSERIVAALLARGAKPDVVSAVGMTPLLGVVSRGDSFPVARRLIEAGANIDAQRSHPLGPLAHGSVLTMAIVGGDARTVALLLERGAALNPARGVPPLMAAALVGNVELVRELIKRGAALNALGTLSGTALNAAFYADHPTVAKLLIEQGADLNLRSVRGEATPPMVWSAYHDAGDPALARLLVARGVDINSANDAGETALSFALKNGPDTALVRYLRSAGAKEPPPARAKPIPARAVPADAEARRAMLRTGAQRAVDLLQRNSTAFLENSFVRNQAKCVSCHQQALPAVAFGLARERGLRVDEHELGRQIAATIAQRSSEAEKARQLDEPTPGRGVTFGYDADGLHALGYPGDDAIAAYSRYILLTQDRDGSWSTEARRPPMQDGSIVGTAWSARALQLYPPAGRERETEAALQRSRTWLAQQPARTVNHRVFQLLGLAWSNETPARMRPFAEALMKDQRVDGGWAQLPGLATDAWATGSALVALHKAGIATTHAAYQRGVEYLLRTQFDDGSWFVKSRTWPFQPHFDGKFPHGKDQWISAAGTAWATIALLLTQEPSVTPASLPNGRQLMAAFAKNSAARESAGAGSPALTPAAKTVDFARDIRPIFERSCAGCHGGERPRGGFTVATREALLKGGFNGEPGIVPGHAEKSDLFRYVSDQVEDLEMPPLDRRDKYPALSAEEIARLRTWIDAGAPWATGGADAGVRMSPSQ